MKKYFFLCTIKFIKFIYLADEKLKNMSHEHSESKPIKYTAFAVFSFVTVFCLLMLFRQCEGDYMKHDAGASHGSKTHDQNAPAKHEEHAASSEHDATKP